MSAPRQLPTGGLSLLRAAVWALTPTAALGLVLLFALEMRPHGDLGLVSRVLYQAIVFVLSLYALLRVHEPDTALADALGLRRAPLSLCVVGMAIGFALQFPCVGLSQLIEHLWPLSATDAAERAAEFVAPALGQKMALFAAAAFVGPWVEELYFRGGLYRALRRGRAMNRAVIPLALYFAAAHLDWRNFLPILLVGLAITWSRALSGSLWPGLALHATFNGVDVLAAFAQGPEDQGEWIVPWAWIAAGLLGASLLFALYVTLARRSPLCASGRERDLS